MNIDINLEKELDAIRDLNEEIRKCLRRYIKNPMNISRNLIENKIDELKTKLESGSVSEHFNKSIQQMTKSSNTHLKLDRRLTDIFKYGHFRKNNRKIVLKSLKHAELDEIDKKIKTISYPDLIKQLIETPNFILDEVDKSRKLARIKKKRLKQTLYSIYSSIHFCLTSILSGITENIFKSTLGVGLAAISYGINEFEKLIETQKKVNIETY